MALKPLHAGREPLQFDGYDLDYLTILGGEIGRLMEVPYVFPGGTDHAAYDSFDGWTTDGAGNKFRTVVTPNLTLTGGATHYRPLFLLDDGTSGYGVMLGTVVGGIVGQVSGTNLGPHTSTGSGKVTCWDKDGTYAVTLDAVDTATLTATTNIAPGAALYATTAGKLTATPGSAYDAGGSATIVGRFLNFATNRSLVTTPAYLATDLIHNTMVKTATQMEFRFNVE